MSNQSVRVLLVEDDEDDYILTREILGEIEGTDYSLHWLSDYDAALRGRAERRDVC